MGDINDSDDYWDSFFTNVFQNSSHKQHRSRTQDRDDHVSYRHTPPDENYRDRSRSPYDRRVGSTSRVSNHSYEHRWQKSTDNYRPNNDNRNSLEVNYPTSTKIRPDLYTGPIHTEESTNAKPEFETYGLNTDFLDYLNIQGPLNSRIYVTNFETKVDELKLREVFHLCGKVVDLYIVGKKQKPRYAVIEFDHPLEAVQAISMLNNQKLYDKELMIRMEKQTDDLKLPAGLNRVGMGLGPDGKPLRNIAARLFANNKQIHATRNVVPKEELDSPPVHTTPSFRNASPHNFIAKRERESPFRNSLPINSTTIRGSPSFRNPSPLNSTTVRVSPPFRQPSLNDSIRDCSPFSNPPPEISFVSDLSSPTYSNSPAHSSSYIPVHDNSTFRRSFSPTFSRDSPPRHPPLDKWYTDLYHSVLEKPVPNYRIKGKKLLMHSKTDVAYKTPQWKEVVPRSERRDRFEKCHRTACGKHLDTARTYRRLSTYYYWPSIRDDVEYYRSLCNICSGPKSR